MKESKFQTQVSKELNKIPNCWHTVMQAGSIRGLPDIIGTVNGVFFGWELKVNQSEAEHTSGRVVLQRYTLGKIVEAGGIGKFVYPTNLQESLWELKSTGVLASPKLRT